MFITAEQISNWLKTTISDEVAEQHIEIAESMVMSHMGVTDLDPRSANERHRILYDMDMDEVIEVRDGPISELVSCTIGGSTDSAGSGGTVVPLEDLVVTPWTVKRIDGELFAKNQDVWLEFTRGYEPPNSASDGGTLPPRVRDAMIITAAELYKSPDTQFDAERIGDYSYQRKVRMSGLGGGPQIPLPERAMLLLRGYRKPSSLI